MVEMQRDSMYVVLFDIDGTLIHSGGAGRMAMIQAFEELFGVPNAFDGISMAGKTDPAILRAAFKKHRLTYHSSDVEKFKTRYFELLSQEIKKDLPLKKIYPGVRELLDALANTTSVHVGLLTGNWVEGAKIKLSYFNLYHYFSFGAFGSDSENRNDLLPFALKRCPGLDGYEIPKRNIIVIGDTPNDVECGKIHGARVLAVASGSYSSNQLLEKGADLVLPDLKNTTEIRNWLIH